MELSTYFEPISREKIQWNRDENSRWLGSRVSTYWTDGQFPDLQNVRLAIIGVCDDRRSVNNAGCSAAPDEIRAKLYPLAIPDSATSLVDLGNIAAGKTPEDTFFATTEVLYKLIERNIVVIILGGGQELTYAQYKSYDVLGRVINIVGIESRFNLEDSDKITSRSYLNHIVRERPNYLFNYTNLGYQTYFCGTDMVKLINDLQFDAFRIGVLQQDMMKAEPLIRAADMVSVNMAAVRQSDAPANGDPSPHGFYGEQLCQLMRFAGMTDKLTSIGFYELNPSFDINHQTAHLTAHAIWFFIEGFYNRKSDFPYRDKQNYKRFLVPMSSAKIEILFYKSIKSDRWWLEVPCNMDARRERYLKQLLIPCTYTEYQQAMSGEIPELWWKFFKRVNN